MDEPPYDPRAIANLLLDLADGEELPVTNLALQKLLYFAHGRYLIQTGKPLLRGFFEAWQHGPVHPAVYQAFKGAGAAAIKERATALDVMTGVSKTLRVPADTVVRRHLRDVLHSYGHLSPTLLRKISHAPKGPWAVVVNKAKTSVALGARITDSVTLECFKHQKISVTGDLDLDAAAETGEPDEDAPLVGNRLGQTSFDPAWRKSGSSAEEI